MKTSILAKTKKSIASFAIMTMLFSLFGPLSETYGQSGPPTITFTPPASQLSQSEVPSSLPLTIVSGTGISLVTFSHNGSGTGVLTGSGDIYILPLSSDLGAHEYIVDARDAEGGLSTTYIIYTVVSDSVLASITITPANPTITSGSTLQLTAAAMDQSGVVITPPPVFAWSSSNSGVVSISASGVISGVSAGTGTISATSTGITGTTLVTVTSNGTGTGDTTPPVITYTGITSPINQSLVPVSIQLNVTDNVGVVSTAYVESGTTNSGVISGGGLIGIDIPNSLGLHTFVVTATDAAGNVTTADISYTVVSDGGGQASIAITPANPIINSGSTLQLTAAAMDQSGVVITPPPVFAWSSSNSGVVSVSTSGVITGVSAGTGTISATSTGVTGTGVVGTTLVTVVSAGTGDTTPPGISYTALPSPMRQNEVPSSLQLTVTDNVGISSVTFLHLGVTGALVGSGNIYSLALANDLGSHEYVVTATDTSGNTASTVISYAVVSDSEVVAITITPANPTINSGSTLQLIATVRDQSGAIITPTPKVDWKSNKKSVVKVNSSGLITGVSAGTGIITATSCGASGSTLVTVVSSGTGDTSAPVITFTPITSPIKQSLVPASISLTITDNVGIVSLVTFRNGVSSGTLVSPSGVYTLMISNALGVHEYVVTARDAAGNTTSATISYTVVSDIDTTAPVITYPPLANQYNQIAVPENLPLTITDDVGVSSVQFFHEGSTGTLVGSGGVYLLALSNDLGSHEYIVTAKDAAGNASSATIKYIVVADSVLNMNILGFNLTNLSSTGLTISWTTDKVASESFVDFYANGTQLLNQAATISGTLNTLSVNSLVPNKTYTLVLKSKANGQQNFTTLTIDVKTSSSESGLVVNKIESVLRGDPVVGGSFENGYHFRFFVTANNLSESGVTLKLGDWSNGASTLPIASNTLMSISANGISSFNSATGSVGVTNSYGAFQSIGSIDSNPELGGRQFIIDLFYKIPAGAQGVYGTTYGIKTQ